MVAEKYIMTDLEDSYFRAEDYLINIVKRAVKHSQDIEISSPGKGELRVLSTQGVYVDNTADLASFCCLPADDFKVSVLDARAPSQETNGRCIKELLWNAGFHASQGRLMEGCYRDDVVELIHWPNLTRLPSTANSMRIASLLAQHPTSLTLAFRMLRIDKAEAFQFYSAARSAGLVRAVNRPAVEPVLKPHRHQALLSLLFNKIVNI